MNKKKRMKKCHDGKQSFDTLELAQQAVHSLVRAKARKGDTVVTFLRAYCCPCGKFHFGRTHEINWGAVAGARGAA